MNIVDILLAERVYIHAKAHGATQDEAKAVFRDELVRLEKSHGFAPVVSVERVWPD